MRRLLLTYVPHAQLLVPRGRDQQVASGIPRQGLDDIIVPQGQGRLASGDIPELDGEIAGRGGENVLGGRVEDDLADLPVSLCQMYGIALLYSKGSASYLE